jgi:hypothetical protein
MDHMFPGLTGDLSPLPPGIFARMERNRRIAVGGAAHFVEMD